MASPSPDEPSGIDPLLGRQPARGRHPSGSGPRPERPRTATRQHGTSGRTARTHAARGARAVALTASALATGAIGSALAYSEGAFGADHGVTDDGTPELSSAAIDGTAAATPDVSTADSTASTTTSTASAADAATTPPTGSDTDTATETTASSSGYADGVYLGTAEYTEWGDVQVEVTVTGGRIVGVTAVDYPQSRKSSDINNRALPLLEADAIELQGADVDIVSGATYTSRTYAESLQAALDAAAIAASSEASA